MKREIAMIAFVLLGMGMTASAQFGKKINLGKALQAGKDVVSAVTLSDADIANMSKEYMVWMDAHNPLTKPDTEYGKRLEKLTGHIKEVDGLKLNFGVYEVVDVNAFACGDGSVRICAGLMEQLFCIGSRQLEGKTKCQRGSFSFDQLKTEGTDFFPVSQRTVVDLFLLFAGIISFLELPIHMKGTKSSNTSF